MLETIQVDEVRIGGREPVSLVVGELTEKDEKEIAQLARQVKINPGTLQKEFSYDENRVFSLKRIKSVKNMKISEEDWGDTPVKDLRKVYLAFNKLNSLDEDEKSSPAKVRAGGNDGRAESEALQ